MATRRARHEKGYTLVELMTVVAIAGILVGLAGWRLDALLPRWRTHALAREIALDLRGGLAIAARKNEPVTFVVDLGGTDSCPGASYRLETADGTTYDVVCLGADYPGVRVTNGGSDETIACGVDLDPPANGCTFCDGDEGKLTLLPSGEIVAPDVETAHAALIVAPRSDEDGANAQAVVVALGTSRIRTHARSGETWGCP